MEYLFLIIKTRMVDAYDINQHLFLLVVIISLIMEYIEGMSSKIHIIAYWTNPINHFLFTCFGKIMQFYIVGK